MNWDGCGWAVGFLFTKWAKRLGYTEFSVDKGSPVVLFTDPEVQKRWLEFSSHALAIRDGEKPCDLLGLRVPVIADDGDEYVIECWNEFDGPPDFEALDTHFLTSEGWYVEPLGNNEFTILNPETGEFLSATANVGV